MEDFSSKFLCYKKKFIPNTLKIKIDVGFLKRHLHVVILCTVLDNSIVEKKNAPVSSWLLQFSPYNSHGS